MKRSHLSALALLVAALLYAPATSAQVVPDSTLPVGERSQVTGDPNVQIEGGARRGGNLFHSFSQFSVPTGGTAYFNNATDVQNIFSRVTGNSFSNIDGLIRTNARANLFLLNPNGILFGRNASLNVGGSFVATTANAIRFANGDIFSANPSQPLPSQLLNINPNAFLFNQLKAQAIVNRSTAGRTGLQVPETQSLVLLGGDVQLEAGQMISPGSRVELGGVAGQGTIGLNRAGNDLRLSFPNGVARSDISFSKGAQINVRGGNGGRFTVTSRNLTMTDRSIIRAGIDPGLGFVGAQAGDVELSAADSIRLDGVSLIANAVMPNAIGNAGNITITTGSLSLLNAAQLIAWTDGQGNAGNVTINARDTVSLDGVNAAGNLASVIFNGVNYGGIGKGGNITVTTGSLFLTNGGAFNISAWGRGDAGSVVINARDTVLMDGEAGINNSLRSGVFGSVTRGAVGRGGDFTIVTGSLFVNNGARVAVSTIAGRGDAGTVRIQARDAVSFDRGNSLSTVGEGAVGQGGNIEITSRSLTLSNGAKLLALSRGNGNAGNIIVNASDGVTLSGQGDPNTPILDFDRPILTGLTPVSGLFSSTGATSPGRGGDIQITTRQLDGSRWR